MGPRSSSRETVENCNPASEDLIRIFTNCLPSRLKNEPPVKIVSRIANSIYSFGINLNYTQNSLKCNLSIAAWCQIVKGLKFFGREWTESPSRIIAVLLSLSDLFFANQILPLYQRICEEQKAVDEENTGLNFQQKNRSGVSGTFMSFSQASKFRSNSKYLRRSQVGAFKALDEIDLDEKEEGVEEEIISEEDENSFEESSNISSDNYSSEEEEKETIRLIDNALNPTGISVDQRTSTNNRKSVKVSTTTPPKKPQINRFHFPHPQSKSDDSDSQHHGKKDSSFSDHEDIIKSNQELRDLKEEQSDFDHKSPITRKTLKLNKRNALNEIRLKKVNFNEKLRITTLTNLMTTDHLMKQVAKETPMEWDNFDVYSGNNKYNIKEVVANFVKNFSRNIALAITNDRGYSQLQLTMTSKYILFNNGAGKSRKPAETSTQYQPSISLYTLEKAKKKAKKIMVKYYEYLEQLVNSYFNQVQLTEGKSFLNTRLKTQKTIEEDMSPGVFEGKSNTKQKAKLHSETLVKYVFLGENIDLETIDYLQDNMKDYLQKFLNSNSSNLWRKCLDLGVFFDYPNSFVLTDASIRSWLISLIINLILINRQFVVIRLDHQTTVDSLLERMKTVIEEAILHGRTYTVIMDLKKIDSWDLEVSSFTARLHDLFNFITMTLKGTILELLQADFLHTIVKRLWEEDYIKALTYEDLLAQTRKLISSNINFLLVVEDADLYYTSSFIQKSHPTLHSKMILRLFEPPRSSSLFEKSINWSLLKFISKNRGGEKSESPSCLTTKRLETDSNTIKGKVWTNFFHFGSIKAKVKTSILPFTLERLSSLIDTAFCYKLYFDWYTSQKFDAAASALQKIICTVPDSVHLNNLAQIHSDDIAACLQDVCLPRILHQEDLILSLLQEGLNLNALHANLLTLCHTLFLDDYSFVPIIYDPQGFSITLFKQMSKSVRQEHAFQYLESKECVLNPAVFSSRLESGCRVVLGVTNLTSTQSDLIVTVVSELSKYFIGRSLGYYKSKSKIPPLKFKDLRMKFHNSFKFGVIVQKRADLNSILSQIFERSLESFVRLLPFEENLGSILVNTKPLIRELETSKKQSEWIAHMNQHFISDRHVTLFTNMGDLSIMFNLGDIIGSKSVNFINPDETKVQLDYTAAIESVLELNTNETSKVTSLVLEDVVKVAIQFKSHISTTSPFDSAYEEKYISFASKDLNSLFQKMLVYFSCLKQGQEEGVDASYLANKLFDCFDLLRQALIQRNLHKLKSDAELKAFEEETKFRQSLASERLIRYIEVESPNFWTQLLLFFFSEVSNSIMPEDFAFTKFWLWSNHSSFDATQIAKFIYSNTFVKRQTISPSMSASKYINSELELEQRDIQVLVKQRLKDAPASPTSRKNRSFGMPLTIDGSPESLQKLFVHLGYKQVDDFAVTMNPFEEVSEENPEIVIKEDTISEPDSPTKPKLRRKMSDLVQEEQQGITEKRLPMLGQSMIKRNTLATPSPSTYKKSRFAQASMSSSQFQSPSHAQHKEIELPSEKKSNLSSNEGNRTPALTEQHNHSQNFEENRRLSRNNLPKLTIITDNLGELSGSLKNIPKPGESLSISKRKNTDIDDSFINIPNQKKNKQGFSITLKEPEVKEIDFTEDSPKKSESNQTINKNEDPPESPILEKFESGYESPKNPSFVDSIISPIRKSKNARRPTEAFNRKISFRLETFQTRGSRSGSPSSSPLKSPNKSLLKGQQFHDIPEDLMKSFNEMLHPNLKRRVIYLLSSVKDCDNFKIYVGALRDMIQRFEEWKLFYESSQYSIYTSDYHIKLPLLRFDSKQTLLTYSETANLLILCRPFEMGHFFKTLPMSNQYLFDTRPSFPVMTKASKFTLITSQQHFLLDLADTLLQSTSIVHIFKPIANEDIEKYANEDKTIVLHGIEFIENDAVENFLARAKFYSQNRLKLIVNLKCKKRLGFAFTGMFDNFVDNPIEYSIKCLSTYLLRIESSIIFNTYSGKKPEKHDLMELATKIDYDYSEEIKSGKETLKDLPKTSNLKSEQEVTEVNYLQVLNTVCRTATGSSSAIDENRTKLILTMLISISIKNLEENRRERSHAWSLSILDAASIIRSFYKIILSIKDNSVQTFKKILYQMLSFEGTSSIATSPPFSSEILKDVFISNFVAVYENSTTSIFKENEVYRFSIKSIKLNFAEIFNTIASFPQVDPNSFSLLTEREVHFRSQHESIDLFNFARFMMARRLFKINFSTDLKLLNSKNATFQISDDQRQQSKCSVVDSTKEVAAFYSSTDTSKFETKLCLILILNSLAEVAKINPMKFIITNNLIEIRMLLAEGSSPLKKGKKSSFGYHKKTSMRQTIHRKSILENFRVDMMRRFSIRNKTGYIDNLEGRDSTASAANRAGLGSISGVAGLMSGKTSFMIARNDSIMSNKQGSMIIKPNIRISRAASKFGSTYFLTDSGKLEFVSYSGSVKRDLFEKNKVLQSTLWVQVLSLNQLITELQHLLSCKSEIYSGEVSSSFGEYEDLVLSHIKDKVDFDLNGHRSESELIRGILKNVSQHAFNKYLPSSLASVYYDKTFTSCWQSLYKKVEYVQQLASRDDAQPTTGFYDLSCLFKPINLFTSYMVQYSFNLNVVYAHSRNLLTK